MRLGVLLLHLTFFGCQLVYPLPDSSHHGEGEHDKRDMTMPAIPRSGLVMVETEFVLGGLEAIFDGPTVAFDTNQCRNGCSCRTPGGEVGEIAIGDIAPDQQAACP